VPINPFSTAAAILSSSLDGTSHNKELTLARAENKSLAAAVADSVRAQDDWDFSLMTIPTTERIYFVNKNSAPTQDQMKALAENEKLQFFVAVPENLREDYVNQLMANRNYVSSVDSKNDSAIALSMMGPSSFNANVHVELSSVSKKERSSSTAATTEENH
jgi:hypothetical protein